MMPPRHLLELLLDIYTPDRAGEPEKISGLSDDVLASLMRRTLSSSFRDVLDDEHLSALASALDRYDPPGERTGTAENASVCRAIYDLFRGMSPDSEITYKEFDRHFKQFTSTLSAAIVQTRAPQLMDMPCREFGELDLDELSKMQAPEALSDYMIGLAKYFRDREAITAGDADHVAELVEKMASAPGYLRFLSKERKYQEVVRLFSVVRDLQSSGIVPGPAMDDMMASLGLLLFNISPSEKIGSYLASLRPSESSGALLYHYNAILALNHMLTGRLDLASAYAARALRRTTDRVMMAYISILRGCIAIRQGNYDQAIDQLEAASSRAPDGRMRGLIAFYRGIIYYEKREYANAIECFGSAGASVTDPLDQVTVHNNIGSCAMHLGDVQRAEREFSKMETLSSSLKGDHAGKCRLAASSYIGAISMARGDHDSAIERYERALKLAVSSKDDRAIANQLGNLGTAYARAGSRTKGMQLLNACMAYSERMGYRAGIRFAYWHICHMLAENGHRSEAEKFSRTYSSRYPELGDLSYEPVNRY